MRLGVEQKIKTGKQEWAVIWHNTWKNIYYMAKTYVLNCSHSVPRNFLCSSVFFWRFVNNIYQSQGIWSLFYCHDSGSAFGQLAQVFLITAVSCSWCSCGNSWPLRRGSRWWITAVGEVRGPVGDWGKLRPDKWGDWWTKQNIGTFSIICSEFNKIIRWNRPMWFHML